MKTTNKYTYLKVIQQKFGREWEDASDYETDSTYYPLEKHFNPSTNKTTTLLNHDLNEYRMMGYPIRVIRRRVLKDLN